MADLNAYQKLKTQNDIQFYSKWIEKQGPIISDYKKAQELLDTKIKLIKNLKKNIIPQCVRENSIIESHKFICFDSYLEKKEIFRFFIDDTVVQINREGLKNHRKELNITLKHFQKYIDLCSDMLSLENKKLKLAELRLKSYIEEDSGSGDIEAKASLTKYENEYLNIIEELEKDFSTNQIDDLWDKVIPDLITQGVAELFKLEEFLQVGCKFDSKCVEKTKNEINSQLYDLTTNYVLYSLEQNVMDENKKVETNKNSIFEFNIDKICEILDRELNIIYEKVCGELSGKHFLLSYKSNQFIHFHLRKPKSGELKSLCQTLAIEHNLHKGNELSEKVVNQIFRKITNLGIKTTSKSVGSELRDKLGFKKSH